MRTRCLAAVLALVLPGAALPAEEPRKPAEPAEKAAVPVVPLKVQFVFARYEGDKKVSSMPYTVYVGANERPAFVRMGIQIPLTTRGDDGSPSLVFKDVGTNLDCRAESLPEGRFRLDFGLEQGSIFSVDGRRGAGGTIPEGAISSTPVLRSFKAHSTMVLRDGQTGQYVSATDPVGGEVLKVEVTLHVVK